MTISSIDPSKINENFPIADSDNNSQGFRDNFAAIKYNLNRASAELGQFLHLGVRDDRPVINLNGNVISDFTRKNTADIRYDIDTLPVNHAIVVNYRNGSYQSVVLPGDSIINLTNIQPDIPNIKKTGKLRLQLTASIVDCKASFISANSTIKYSGVFPFADGPKLNIKHSTTGNATTVDIWLIDDGYTTPIMYIEYIGYAKKRCVTPPAITHYSDITGAITASNSSAASTDDTTPGIKISTSLPGTPSLYIDGLLVVSSYTGGVILPVATLADGLHTFTYTLTDPVGNESDQSPGFGIIIDTTAPTVTAATQLIKNSANAVFQSSEVGTAYLIKSTLTAPTSKTDADALVTNSANSAASVTIAIAGTNTNIAATGLIDGTYNIYTVDAAGNLSNASTNIVTIDTTAPITGALALTIDTGASSTDGNTSNGQITVSGLEVGTTWEYSINTGSSWSTGNGSSFSITPGTYLAGALKVRQTDLAGNIQTSNMATNSATIIIDTTAPITGALALTVDNGASPTDGNTSNGQITVSGLEVGATWEYSLDNGISWSAGSGSTFTIANGTYNTGTIKVRQTDGAGNVQNTSIATNAIAYTIAPEPVIVPPQEIPGIPASNAAWGGAGNGGTANYKGGYSAASGHNGNAGGGSASPLGGNGANWTAIVETQGTYGTGGSGGGYTTAGVAGTGTLPGYDQSVTNATGIGNGGGGVETDGVNGALSNTRVGHGTGGLIRITIADTGSYTFTTSDLTAFSGTRLIAGNRAIEWDNSSAIKTSSDPYDNALYGFLTIPVGVTKINIGVIGGGGGGAIGPCTNAGGGGGGGALYVGYNVVPGDVYTIKVGSGGQGGFQSGSRGTAGGAPYGVTEAPWRGGKSAFCNLTGTALIYATGGNTRPDNCAGVTNADSATANTADIAGTNAIPPA